MPCGWLSVATAAKTRAGTQSRAPCQNLTKRPSALPLLLFLLPLCSVTKQKPHLQTHLSSLKAVFLLVKPKTHLDSPLSSSSFPPYLPFLLDSFPVGGKYFSPGDVLLEARALSVDGDGQLPRWLKGRRSGPLLILFTRLDSGDSKYGSLAVMSTSGQACRARGCLNFLLCGSGVFLTKLHHSAPAHPRPLRHHSCHRSDVLYQSSTLHLHSP